MPYPSKAIANYFIDLADKSKNPITPLKLQKLMYYAHGWNLAIRLEPLIDELVEAWEWGPVIPSIYHEFKIFGNGSITSLATEFKMIDGKLYFIPPSIDDNPDEVNNRHTKMLLNKVWEVYGNYTAGQLSTMTHADDSPWAITREKTRGRKNADIPDADIQAHFRIKAKENEQSK